jgi:hypothetical protein
VGKIPTASHDAFNKKAGSKATGFQFLVYGFSGVRRIGAPAIHRDSGSFFVMRLL